MEKRQASLDTFFGKRRRRLDLEDVAPTADVADESQANVDDRQSTSGAAQAVTNDNLVVVQIDF